MRNFLQNWNYLKHATAISSFYLGTSIVGNALLGKKVPEDEKSICPLTVCKQLTKKQWVFNGILSGLYCVDMSLTYIVLRHLRKQYK